MSAPSSRPFSILPRSCAVLLAITATVAAAQAQTTPSSASGARGHLVVIGGGNRPASVMQLFARLAGGEKGKVLVFPQASELADTGERLQREMSALGIGSVTVVGVGRDAADADETLRLTDGATGVFFGGGDQSRLMAALRGSKLEARLLQLYRDGAVMAGTSAGAAVMSRVMITGDERRPVSEDAAWQTIESGNVVTGTGLGLLDDVIVDQHFVLRRRAHRLISLVIEHPESMGVGIDEATAVWVKPDRTFEVVGEGPVFVVDARGARTSRDSEGHGLRASDLRVHVLRSGSRYDLAGRSVITLQP